VLLSGPYEYLRLCYYDFLTLLRKEVYETLAMHWKQEKVVRCAVSGWLCRLESLKWNRTWYSDSPKTQWKKKFKAADFGCHKYSQAILLPPTKSLLNFKNRGQRTPQSRKLSRIRSMFCRQKELFGSLWVVCLSSCFPYHVRDKEYFLRYFSIYCGCIDAMASLIPKQVAESPMSCSQKQVPNVLWEYQPLRNFRRCWKGSATQSCSIEKSIWGPSMWDWIARIYIFTPCTEDYLLTYTTPVYSLWNALLDMECLKIREESLMSGLARAVRSLQEETYIECMKSETRELQNLRWGYNVLSPTFHIFYWRHKICSTMQPLPPLQPFCNVQSSESKNLWVCQVSWGKSGLHHKSYLCSG